MNRRYTPPLCLVSILFVACSGGGAASGAEEKDVAWGSGGVPVVPGPTPPGAAGGGAAGAPGASGGASSSGGTAGFGGMPSGGGAPVWSTGGAPQWSAGGASQGSTGGSEGGTTGGAPGAGGAPPTDTTPTAESASTRGPYAAKSYKNGWAPSPKYGAAQIWYPENAAGPSPGVSVVPGFMEFQLVGWGEFLASHGYVVITLDTLTLADQPPQRGIAVMGGLETLASENLRAGSPIAGKLDAAKLAIMGHSMGGGGTLDAAQVSSHKIRAAIALCPWEGSGGSFGGVTAPTMIIAAQADFIAPIAEHATPFYLSLPATTKRAYVEMLAADHFVANDPKTNRTVARVGLSWLEVYLRGDLRYSPFIDRDANMSQFGYHP